VNKKVFCSCYL